MQQRKDFNIIVMKQKKYIKNVKYSEMEQIFLLLVVFIKY